MAYYFGLLPWELERLTPYELNLIFAAVKQLTATPNRKAHA